MNLKEKVGTDRIAVGIATAALLLLFVFFYALQRNVTGLGREIEELKSLNQAVLDLDNRHTVLDGKVTDMAHAAQDLDQRLDGKHRDKLAVIKALLQEIGDDLHGSKK